MVFIVFSSLLGKVSISNVSKVYGWSSNLSLGGSKTMRLCRNPSLENILILFWAWVSLWGAFCDLLGSFGTPWDRLGDPLEHPRVTWEPFWQPLGSLVCLWASILTDFDIFLTLWAQKLIKGIKKTTFSWVWLHFFFSFCLFFLCFCFCFCLCFCFCFCFCCMHFRAWLGKHFEKLFHPC